MSQPLVQSHQQGGTLTAKHNIVGDQPQQSKKKITSPDKTQHESDTAVGGGSLESQDIDRKIAKEMSIEIEKLNGSLIAKDVQISHLQRELEVLRQRTGGLEVLTTEERVVKENPLVGAKDYQNVSQSIDITVDAKSRTSAVKAKIQRSSRHMDMLYAFISGGLLMFLLSAVVGWFRTKSRVISGGDSS